MMSGGELDASRGVMTAVAINGEIGGRRVKRFASSKERWLPDRICGGEIDSVADLATELVKRASDGRGTGANTNIVFRDGVREYVCETAPDRDLKPWHVPEGAQFCHIEVYSPRTPTKYPPAFMDVYDDRFLSEAECATRARELGVLIDGQAGGRKFQVDSKLSTLSTSEQRAGGRGLLWYINRWLKF